MGPRTMRTCRFLPLVAAVVLSSAACDDAPTEPADGPTGQWNLTTAEGLPLPAVVAVTQYLDDQQIVRHVEHQVLTGWILLSPAGGYQQRIQTRAYQDGHLVSGRSWNDRGVYALDGDVYRFESEIYQNHEFEGTVNEAGRLLLAQDVIGEDVLTELVYVR